LVAANLKTLTNLTEQTLAALDREGLADDSLGRRYPRVPAEPAEFFRMLDQ
jgi:hypothetical protein